MNEKAVSAGNRKFDMPDLCWSLAEASPLPTAAVAGARHTICYVNPAFCLLVGSPKQNLIGKRFSSAVPAGKKCIALLDRVYQSGRAEVHAGQEQPGSHRFYWSYALWPVLDAGGRHVGTMIQITETTAFLLQTTAMNQALILSSLEQHELTEAAEQLNARLQAEVREHQQAEAALTQQSQELIRSNADLQQFAYVISHDLQEPLRTMIGFSQLLLQRYGGQLDSDAHEFLEHIVSSAQRMQSLIEALLTYSRVVNVETMPLTPVPLHAALQWATMNLQTVMAETQARVTHDELPTVPADQLQLVQLLQNLIGNAIKYRQAEEPPHVHLSAALRGQEWVIAVQDNGIGIKPEHFERIFGVFKRLHGREIAGTGIGLAIAKRIIEKHNGQIWVESEPGQGSTFYFSLPS